jgi:hypothetical protein
MLTLVIMNNTTPAEISPQDLQDIKEALKTVQDNLPFLIHLSTQERRRAYKMGDKSLAFVTNSLSAAEANPGILPGSFDVAALNRNYRLSQNLLEILTQLKQLTEQVDDTLMAVSSNAMDSSLQVYDYVKTAAKREPGLKSLAEQLGERFKKMGRRSRSKTEAA